MLKSVDQKNIQTVESQLDQAIAAFQKQHTQLLSILELDQQLAELFKIKLEKNKELVYCYLTFLSEFEGDYLF